MSAAHMGVSPDERNHMSPTTVRESVFALARNHGISKVFGNPGSNEIPFLAGLPEDMEFVLGLHEQVVVGMAEGYSRATGEPALVNLHAASGSGNAMGALTNARSGNVPLVVIAGQQVRRTVGQETMLSNTDAATLPAPLVKYAHEPLAAADVPRALSEAIFEATTHPRGPVYLSVPLDDWEQPALESDALLLRRSVLRDRSEDGLVVRELTRTLNAGTRVALVVGGELDAAAVDQPAVFAAVQELAEKLDASVFIAPSPYRCAFPTTHPSFEGVLVPGIASVQERLAPFDTVLVIGAPVFRYHRWEPADYVSPDAHVCQLTEDPHAAARAPFGRSYLAEIGSALLGLARDVTDRGVRREATERRHPEPDAAASPLTGHDLLQAMNTLVDDTVVYVNETTTLDLDYLERVDIDRPGMYHFPASGGLGFGLPAAVGFAIGDPQATVVATIGDGSANFGITALYTAAQRQTRTIFIIINNSGYGALAGFSQRMGADHVPGLELGGIDFVAISQGYGVSASRVTSLEEFVEAYRFALTTTGPILIEAIVQ